ncbi:MAG: hypothetical protein ABI435_01170 [Pseudolysinimonas sp.]
MNDTFSPERSDAIRTELVAVVDRAPARPPRRILVGVGLVVAGLLAGGGATAATAGIWHPQPFLPQGQPVTAPTSNLGVVAPAGYAPGQPIVSLVGGVTSYVVDGQERIIQLAVPDGATHLRVTVTCTSAGTTAWGFDAGGNNPNSSCGASDVDTLSATGYMDFDLNDSSAYPQRDLFYVQPGAGVSSIVTLQYLNLIETAWVVNAAGETCGVAKAGFGEPDLVGVEALTPSGEYVTAYARSEQLAYPFPGQTEPTSPADALAQQAQHQQQYPAGIDIPAFECDGVTQVGVFHVG